jgi:FlaA1/EpsC-like NDP-sugar epimerase
MKQTFQKLQTLYPFLRKLAKKHLLPRWFVFLQDTGAVFLTFMLAYLLRFNLNPSGFSAVRAIEHAGIALTIYSTFNLFFKPYSGILRLTTIRDMFIVLISNSLSFMVLCILTHLGRLHILKSVFNIPLSILIIHFVTLTALMLLVRVLIRMFYEMIITPYPKKKNVLVFGAGATGLIVRQIIRNDTATELNILGFIDDSKKMHKKQISGIPIFSQKILENGFINKNNIKSLIFAVKKINPKRKAEIIRISLNRGLEVLEIPEMEAWINGKFELKEIRKVKVEDLLGRDPIMLDQEMIEKGLSGKTILVTGAAGSIGSEIVRQLARFSVGKLIIVDNAETPLFHVGLELQEKYPGVNVVSILADVTQTDKMERLFHKYSPHIVFHAAAYKHVPVMEENPHEAFRVNVGGTSVLVRLSARYGVEKFVMISTDKAVNPTNIMGASKRVCEMIVQAKSQQPGVRTQFVVTRFGNVLGSNGSVIPLFIKQIERGGPVTVTHPEINRYFMTIPEACQLVLEAGFMGKGGEIFEFDMGRPIKIDDLARQMICLYGLTPGKDIQVEYTGLRPGEKLYEELLSDLEITLPTHHPKIRIARADVKDRRWILNHITNLTQNIYNLTEQEVLTLFRELVPEFRQERSEKKRRSDEERVRLGDCVSEEFGSV